MIAKTRTVATAEPRELTAAPLTAGPQATTQLATS